MDVSATALRTLPWRDPAAVARWWSEEPGAVLLASGGAGGRWSYFARQPDRSCVVAKGDGDRNLNRLRRMLGSQSPGHPDGPPFQGGVIGLIAYEFADRLEPLGLARDPGWPDMTLAEYRSVLAFDHHRRTLTAIGRGENLTDASCAADRAMSWLEGYAQVDACDFPSGPPGRGFQCRTAPGCYGAAVEDVKSRIRAGEIFQANIARRWTGQLETTTTPFEVFARLLRRSPAPYAAYWRGDDLALVSHSPERFVAIAGDGASVETRPIKGTRPRGADPAEDARLAAELAASAKDRAENLMIVDLMRNDLARVCLPGSVTVPKLYALESFASVHHLVSTVKGRLQPDKGPADLLETAFPPGSITGAPKIQAMKVIAAHEAPRGPWCGTLFWAGYDGAMDSSVLIRTAAFVQKAGEWRFAVRAGAGIVADSDPAAETLETEAKVAGLAQALMGRP